MRQATGVVVVEADAGWESVGALEALRACDFARLVRALGVSVGKWYFDVIRVLGLDVSFVLLVVCLVCLGVLGYGLELGLGIGDWD